MENFIIVLLVVILLILLLTPKPAEKFTRYIIPQTLKDRYKYKHPLWDDNVTLFYEPKILTEYNRCGDYGFCW